MASIVVIDDDLAMDMVCDSLRFRSHETYRIGSTTDALSKIRQIISTDLVVLDIIMSWPEDRTATSLSGAHTAGMEVLREIRKRNKEIPVIVYSATQDAALIDAIEADLHTSYLSKWETQSIRELIQRIHCELGISDKLLSPQPFIVHGHNESTKLTLKNYLQNTLLLPEPIILHEKPNLGRTIIEKFEEYAAMSVLVFVLLTPDDVTASDSDTDEVKRRARQNVIFELGYFLGILGRRSGCIFLLYHPPLELPSDLCGVVYIDISKGIEAAGEEIRREVKNAKY